MEEMFTWRKKKRIFTDLLTLFVNKLTWKDDTNSDSLFLYVADPATSLASNSVFSTGDSLFIRLWKQ